MSEIARGVGVQKATLYNYYGSKEDLLLDLLENGLTAWTRASRSALLAEGPLRERLREHLAAVVTYAIEHPHEAAVIRLAATQIGGELGAEVRERLARHREGYAAVLEREFAAAIEQGEVRPADPAHLGTIWRALMNGMLMQHLFEDGCDDCGGDFEPLLEIVWNGMVAEEAGA